jgi:hypothetical protein
MKNLSEKERICQSKNIILSYRVTTTDEKGDIFDMSLL